MARKIAVLGVKEFPWGSAKEKHKTGGMEKYVNDLILSWRGEEQFIIFTRAFSHLPRVDYLRNHKILRFSWLDGFYIRNPSFNLHVVLYLLFSKKDYDILFVHGPVAGVMALILARIKKVNSIYVPHGRVYEQPQYPKWIRKIMGLMERINFLFHDYVVFFSKSELIYVEKKFIVKNPVIIHTAANFDYSFDLSKKKINKRDKIVILFVGRLLKVKGWNVLLDAINIIKEKRPEIYSNIELWIVGEGKDKKLIEKRISEKQLDNVFLWGWKDNIQDYYSNADIFVLPSYSEGFPLTILEAAYFSLPIITSSFSLDMEARITFNIGDPNDLAEKIILLVDNKKLRTLLGREARKYIEKHNLDIMLQKYAYLFTQ